MKCYINGIILDGTKDMKPVADKAIITDGNRIVKIIDNNIINKEEYDEIINLDGKYIMPGLINLHIHLPASGKPSKKKKNPKKLVKLILKNNLTKKLGVLIEKKFAQTELLSGVTTIRTVGGVANFDTIVRDNINSGKYIGPRILASNMAISVPEGHMAGSLAYEVKNINEASIYTNKIISEKPDLIKLMITGGVLDAKVEGEPGELKMSPDIVKEVTSIAHKHNLKCAAHVESPEGVKVALLNGVDTIEHGAKPDEEIIKLFKEHNAALVSTLSPAIPYALFDRTITGISSVEQHNGKIVFDGIISCAKACLENDILVGLGTDVGCPYITHYNIFRELYYFHKYLNVSNSFALHTATLVNAKILGLDNIIGSIEENKLADFIITKENPLDNLEALRNISYVVADGKIIKNPKVKKYTKVEKVLDKYM